MNRIQIMYRSTISSSLSDDLHDNIFLTLTYFGAIFPPRCGIAEYQISQMNRPFPSSCLAPLQSEAKCEVFVMKISSHSYVK